MATKDVAAVMESADSFLGLTHVIIKNISVLVRPLRVLTQFETLDSACLLKLTSELVFGNSNRDVLDEHIGSHSFLDVERDGI
jgi:hypothetical protein